MRKDARRLIAYVERTTREHTRDILIHTLVKYIQRTASFLSFSSPLSCIRIASSSSCFFLQILYPPIVSKLFFLFTHISPVPGSPLEVCLGKGFVSGQPDGASIKKKSVQRDENVKKEKDFRKRMNITIHFDKEREFSITFELTLPLIKAKLIYFPMYVK